jgi:hypothetical protein
MKEGWFGVHCDGPNWAAFKPARTSPDPPSESHESAETDKVGGTHLVGLASVECRRAR